MKKNKFFYRIRVFFLVFLFILPCFSLLACSGGGGDGGSGGNSLFGDIPSYTTPTDKGMLELTPDDGIRLKYLYKPQDLSPYYEKIKAGIFNSAENTLVNLVGEYGTDTYVDVYNEEYADTEPLKTILSPFETVSESTYKQLFNGNAIGPTIKTALSKCEFAYYDATNKWYAIGPSDIPANFITFADSEYKINISGILADASVGGSGVEVTAGGVIEADKIYSFSKSGATFYIWVGTASNIVSSTGVKNFTEKLLDTHYNAINRSIVNVEGEVGSIVITKEKWEWSLEEWDTDTFLEAYLEEYKNLLAINIAKIVAYGTGELTGNAKILYQAAIANPNIKAEEFVEDCVLRIDHIGLSSDEADMVADFIVENVVGTTIMAEDSRKYSYSGSGDSDKFYANEIADGMKRVLMIVDEDEEAVFYNNTIVIDESAATDSENGFRRTALFKNYYNTARTSLERTRLVFPETPIVDYVDVAYNVNSDDVFDITYEEPANGKIQSIVLTNVDSKDLQLASISFMITSIHDENQSTWTVDTLDIYIYANHYHNGVLTQYSLDSMYLSKLDPDGGSNGIPDEYGTLNEKTYNIWDNDDSPALIGKELVLSQNTHTELDTEDWGGLKDGNASDFDKKNSITENTFKNFKSVNYGYGNSAAYNGGGDYIEFCFVVNGNDATLLDFYSYSIMITGLYGKQV